MKLIKTLLEMEHESEVIERIGFIFVELLECGVTFAITSSKDILVSYNGESISICKLVESIESESDNK